MRKKQELFSSSQLELFTTEGAGYDVLRYISLPELLGKEANTLLYFMGRNLARKFAINDLEDLITIYDKLGWGKLELVKEKKKELLFQLMADSVALRLQASFTAEFRMEAGFLAEAIQKLNGIECECIEEINKRIHQVAFKIVYTK
ncbi:DUF2507 domain-containing protein [Oceanobacillus sp. 143]|jgi:predicted hydrocarbon binding protein|uniref:DUF2507 domain-containing protein n=1 Tax=Oceanobacillus zhaokaii TaxID=2052660 RepID=A0A345PHZ3_9BACI|nr:DUF2507 domain-containing protein [Oceanobacillus zhaokaii]AXI09623.1 DUF2507 domain-containing protein [Oceanobacillus zhaokaii]QGS68978.1 DUF2507 domain-containing protein [Oceanobacillus sp. 143]